VVTEALTVMSRLVVGVSVFLVKEPLETILTVVKVVVVVVAVVVMEKMLLVTQKVGMVAHSVAGQVAMTRQTKYLKTGALALYESFSEKTEPSLTRTLIKHRLKAISKTSEY